MNDIRIPEPLSITRLRADLRRILDAVCYFGRCYVIMRSGNGVAILLGVEDFQELLVAAGAAVKMERKPDSNS